MKDEDRMGVRGGQCLHAKPVESQADGSSAGNSFAVSAKSLKHAYIMYLGVPSLGISSQGIIRDVGRNNYYEDENPQNNFDGKKMRNCAEYEVK